MRMDTNQESVLERPLLLAVLSKGNQLRSSPVPSQLFILCLLSFSRSEFLLTEHTGPTNLRQPSVPLLVPLLLERVCVAL